MRTLIAFLVLVLSLSAQCANGQAVCDAALVKSTYNSFSSDQLDWRLATLVTENDYNEIKQEAGASAVIYGIPVSANYGDYQKQVHDKLSSYNASLSRNQLRNILWTGLDANASGAYEKCLESQVLATRGLHIAVNGATRTDISILIRWNPVGPDPAQIAPSWTWSGPGLSTLPKNVRQGEMTVVVPRPKQQRTLAINYQGFSDKVVLEPLSKLPPIPAPAPLINTTEVYLSDNAASGNCANFGAWAKVCSTDKPDGWTLVSQIFELTGDRAGCAYAECKPESPPTSTKACYVFRTQGHSEECGHSGNTGIHYSQGKLTVVWAHR